MNWKSMVLSVFVIMFLAACGNEKETDSQAIDNKGVEPETETISKGESEDVKGLVAEYSANKTTDEKASITSTQLIITDTNENKITYDLPEDEFFISIAPYVNETHPCKDHSLTGCQGELVQKEIDVFIENEKGEVIVDEKLTTLENGFIDLWLPRNEAFIVEMSYDGKSVTGDLTTFEEDGTCITTLQLL
ncbi:MULTISPECIES: CueP family metal-binding protein [unclassified Solibacillus]|uniref:CueP family metal-binding protein n=1 Tax=unclassified Solibacillus TaxID=2637870 RepID=UPI0030FCD61C